MVFAGRTLIQEAQPKADPPLAEAGSKQLAER